MKKIDRIDFPIHLRVRDVVQAAKEARENGTLQALVSPGGCSYWCERTKTQCAVGQAFTPEAAAEFQRHLHAYGYQSDIAALITEGFVTTDNAEALAKLQIVHDGIHADFSVKTEEGRVVPDPQRLHEFDQLIELYLAQ